MHPQRNGQQEPNNGGQPPPSHSLDANTHHTYQGTTNDNAGTTHEPPQITVPLQPIRTGGTTQPPDGLRLFPPWVIRGPQNDSDRRSCLIQPSDAAAAAAQATGSGKYVTIMPQSTGYAYEHEGVLRGTPRVAPQFANINAFHEATNTACSPKTTTAVEANTSAGNVSNAKQTQHMTGRVIHVPVTAARQPQPCVPDYQIYYPDPPQYEEQWDQEDDTEDLNGFDTWCSKSRSGFRSTRVEKREIKALKFLAQAREAIDDAKDKLLDWISPIAGKEYGPEMPPCPPCDVVCGCPGPTEIRRVPEINCDCCGDAGGFCASCGGYVRHCPTCGQPFRPRPFSCPLLSCQKAPPAMLPPELVVTNVGPFRDKRFKEPSSRLCASSQAFSDMLCDAAHGYGYLVGSKFSRCCGRRYAPPAPVPGRPIQQMVPCFFPDVPVPRARFPWNLCKRQPPLRQPPRGGIIGALEDIAMVGVGLASAVVESTGDVLDQLAGVPERCSTSRRYHCNCDPPAPRYPTKHGVYDEPPDPPTRSTGCRPLDALNNFMDALTFPPNPDAEKLIPQQPLPETEETGNRVVDGVNAMLDTLLPPPPEPELRPIAQKPLTALVTYLADKPRPLPREPNCAATLMPCFFADETGLRCVDRYLPDACFGEHLPECKSDTGRLDYVQFNLMPTRAPRISQPCPSRLALPASCFAQDTDAYIPRPLLTPVAHEQPPMDAY